MVHGFDIRKKGTGNAGASNMVTTVGWSAGFLTMCIDILKSYFAVKFIGYIYPSTTEVVFLQYLAGFSAVLGHIFPFFMSLKGGKGLASFIGLIMAIDPLLGFYFCSSIVLLTLITGYVALGSILAYIIFPLYGYYTQLFEFNVFVLMLILGVVGVYKHRENIRNMLSGSELSFWTVVKGKHKKNYYILDFDSTIISVETLDELASVSLKEDPDKDEKIDEIKSLTEEAMNGEMHFMEALEERIRILDASVDDLKILSKVLNDKITPSFQSNVDFFKDNAQNTFIVSGGFTELIFSTVKDIGIPKENIFANYFTFDNNNKIIGVDKSQFLAQKLGKVDAVQSLELDGTVYAIGDGWTDYQIKEAGLADYFIAFTEIVERPAVIKKGDIVATSFYDVLEFIKSTKK